MSVGEQQRPSVARALANTAETSVGGTNDREGRCGESADGFLQLFVILSENNVSLLLVTHARKSPAQFDRVEKLADFNRPQRLRTDIFVPLHRSLLRRSALRHHNAITKPLLLR